MLRKAAQSVCQRMGCIAAGRLCPLKKFCAICCLCRQHQWLCTAEAASQKLWGEHVYRISVALYERKELWLGVGEAAAQAKI